MTDVFAPSVYPFTVSAGVMLGLVVMEGLTLMLGISASGLIEKSIDHGVDADAGEVGSVSGLLNWFNMGGIPFLALVILATALFSAVGFAIQAVATSLVGPLPTSVAAVAAFAGALPATRYGSRLVAGIVPRDETYAVTLDDLVGRTGKVMLGPLDQGMPGTVSTTDVHGNRHTLKAMASPGEDPIPPGAPVLVVDRKGQVYTVVPAPANLIP